MAGRPVTDPIHDNSNIYIYIYIYIINKHYKHLRTNEDGVLLVIRGGALFRGGRMDAFR